MGTPTINGVPVEQLKDTVEAIKDRPSLARCNFRLQNRWMGGAHNRSAITSFEAAGETHISDQRPFIVGNGEHPVLFGKDEAPNPVENLLHALAGCLTTTLVYRAAALGIHLESVETRLDGDLDLRGLLGLSDEVRKGYEKIRVSFRIKGDATEEELKALVEHAKAHSPVCDAVCNPVPVEVNVERAVSTAPAAC